MAKVALPLLLSLLAPAVSLAVPPVPFDAQIRTWYSLGKSVNFTACGSIAGSKGCFGGGTLGPLSCAGSILEGAPTYLNATCVERPVYVVDACAGPTKADAVLHVFSVTLTGLPASEGSLRVSSAQVAQVPLPLTGGDVKTSMVGTDVSLFIATNAGGNLAFVSKTSLLVRSLGGGSGNVSDVTVTSSGDVLASFFDLGSGAFSSYLFGVDGSELQVRGGFSFLLDTRIGETWGTVRPVPFTWTTTTTTTTTTIRAAVSVAV